MADRTELTVMMRLQVSGDLDRVTFAGASWGDDCDPPRTALDELLGDIRYRVQDAPYDGGKVEVWVEDLHATTPERVRQAMNRVLAALGQPMIPNPVSVYDDGEPF